MVYLLTVIVKQKVPVLKLEELFSMSNIGAKTIITKANKLTH